MTERPSYKILPAVKKAVSPAHFIIVKRLNARNDVARKTRFFGDDKFHFHTLCFFYAQAENTQPDRITAPFFITQLLYYNTFGEKSQG